MAKTLANTVFDDGLNSLRLVGKTYRIDICSQAPTTFTEATSTYTLGDATATITGPTDGDTSGRKVTIGAVTDAAVDSSGTANHYAVSNQTDSVLLVVGELASAQSVTSGNTFSLTAVDIEIPDPI